LLDFEAPWVKRSLRLFGYAADGIAILTFVYQATRKQPPPSWALLLFIVGLVLIFTGARLRGDFIISRREIYVDIKRWDPSTGTHHDEATTYRFDHVMCRKQNARHILYQDYSTSGQRTSVDVINFPVTLKPKLLSPAAMDLEIDLGTNCDYGKKYQIYSRCEYVDTFPDSHTEAYIVKISYPTKLLKITIFLPSNKMCTDASVSEEVGAAIETQDPLPTISENRRVISWEKKKPAFNAEYKVSWNW